MGWWLVPESRISEANCERICVGMTGEQVEAILGSPGENFGYGISLEDHEPSGFKIWEDGGNWIIVSFASGRVRDMNFVHRTPWQRLDDWYHDREWHPGGMARRLEAAA